MGLDAKIKDIKARTYIGEDATKVITATDETNKDILSLREIMFSSSIITTSDEGGVVTCYFDSYSVMESNLDEIMVSLIPYLKNISTTDGLNKTLKSKINEYIKHLKDFNSAMDNLVTCQKAISGQEMEMVVLQGNYSNLKIKYRRCLNSGANVVINMLNIIKSNYKTILFDTKLSLIDCYVRSLYVSSSEGNLKTEPFYAHDLHLVLDKLNKVKNGTNIFDDTFTEVGYLNSYNNLINNYLSDYTKALSKTNFSKKEMADNRDLSDIRIDAQSSLVYVLNVLGF